MKKSEIFGKHMERWKPGFNIALLKEVSNIRKSTLDEERVKEALSNGSSCFLKRALGWYLNDYECDMYAHGLYHTFHTDRTETALKLQLKKLFGCKSDYEESSYQNRDGVKTYSCKQYSLISKEIKSEIPSPVKSFLLNKALTKTCGRVGLEWMKKGGIALYVYPNFEKVDYARMYLEVVEYLKDRGKTLQEVLKSRPNETLDKIFNVFLEDGLIPLNSSSLIPDKESESSISILTSVMMADLVLLLDDLLNQKYYDICFENQIYDELMASLRYLGDKIYALVSDGILQENPIYERFKIIYKNLSEYNFKNFSNDVGSNNNEEVVRKVNIITKTLSHVSKSCCLFPPFYLLMSALFELYVYVRIDKLYIGSDYKVEYQKDINSSKPDITLTNINDNSIIIVDAKYKHYEAEQLQSDDSEQAITVVKKYGLNRCKKYYIAYPGRAYKDPSLPLELLLNSKGNMLEMISIHLPSI